MLQSLQQPQIVIRQVAQQYKDTERRHVLTPGHTIRPGAAEAIVSRKRSFQNQVPSKVMLQRGFAPKPAACKLIPAEMLPAYNS